jgi:hypothetical protein
MSKMARTDEIDELVSSVRDFVSHKEQLKEHAEERLVLMLDQRVAIDHQDAEEEADVDQLQADNVHKLDAHHEGDRAGLEATIAELEAAVTAQPGDWEADEGEDFANAAWAASAFETPETQQDDTQTPSSDQAAPRDALVAAIADSIKAGLDQDVLRALVVTTVHEELGGELGERITQNVRKMVRREIKRVMASQDFGPD